MNTRGNPQNLFRILHGRISRSVHFLYETCIAPRSEDEDTRGKEFILNVILATSILVTGLLEGSLIRSWLVAGSAYRGISISLFSGIVIFFGVLLYLSRKGQWYTASYLLVLVYYLSSTYGIAKWGVELPLAGFGFVITIIISSILINTRFAFLVTICTSLTLIIFGYLQVSGDSTPEIYWKALPITIKDPIQLSLILFLIMTVSWLSNREIERSLKRARASEQELMKERDMLEIRMEERTKELKHMQAEKVAQLYRFAEFGRLSSGLFHDLMKPLNALIGHIDKLKQEDTNGEVASSLEKAVSSSRRMGDLLMAIKKQVRTDVAEQHFFPSKEIREALDILGYQAREAKVTFEISLDDFITYGNPLKFHQIAINLIANAVDACKAKSSEGCHVWITLSVSNNDAVFNVVDEGIGIPLQLREKIFNTFFTTKHKEGMGLGLSTTKDIVEKDFGGTIAVQSVEGSGSTFTIMFPIRHNEGTT